MSAPLPSSFLSPVFIPFSPSPGSDNHELPSEQHGSPSPRKRERVKSFVKNLASPFASPSPSPAHLLPETGSPPSPTISLSPELHHSPSVLRKRERVNSTKSVMKNPSTPHSSPSPLPSPFPSPDKSGLLSPDLNHSSPEIDPHASPTRKRERVKSFVKSIRRTSSQLFKKDKKDREVAQRRSSSALSALVSDSISVSTAPFRRFSHSKQPSISSMTATETSIATGSDLSAGHLDISIEDEGPTHSPIVEVATPVSPTLVGPLDAIPASPLKETPHEEGTSPDTQAVEVVIQPTEIPSVEFDPLQSPLPPSPLLSPTPLMDPVGSIQIVVSQDDVDPAPHNEEGSPSDDLGDSSLFVQIDPPLHDVEVSLSDDSDHASLLVQIPNDNDAFPSDDSENSPLLVEVQPPATEDMALTIPLPDESAQPSPASPSPSISNLGSGVDEQDLEMRAICTPSLFPPVMFCPIPNMRLSCFFTPVLTWWLSKDVLSFPYLHS